MADMTSLEKLLALRATPCFDRLHESELSVVAQVAVERRFAPNETVIERGQVPGLLFVVVDGAVVDSSERRAWAVVGAESLLFGDAQTDTLVAAEEHGARCLVLGRAHFYTLLYQCPAFILGLLRGADYSGEEHP